MQYAIVDDERREAVAGERGHCPICGAETIPKCGPRVVHHWAHKGRRDCDPWWENETDWHREWKGYFPEECREITHVAEDGEIHRADIKTPTGIIIEVQHSSMTDAERTAREVFYGNLVWIIDGRGFRQNFDVYHELPHPNSAIAADIVWEKARRGMKGTIGGMFYRLSEETQRMHPDKDITKANVRSLIIMVEVHSLDKIQTEVNESYCGHHQYDWVRPRRVWLDSSCPIFIDFGSNELVKLEIYDASGLPCVRYVAKRALVQDAMRETDARAIGNV